MMDNDRKLHFEVGQLVEARSFLQGFRGAWFRCKIKEISWRNGSIVHLQEYYDFPDEKEKWTKIYQVPPISRKKGIQRKRELMVRPSYPPIYPKNEKHRAHTISEVIVICDGTWKVGDMVDWWKDHCYWSGKVTEILNNQTAKVELTPPPLGEGSSYEVSFQDLRPSLDWSPEIGWTVPTSTVGGTSPQCARLVHPVHQASGDHLVLQMPALGKRNQDLTTNGISALPVSSHVDVEFVAASEELKISGTGEGLKEPSGLKGTPEINMNLVQEDNVTGITIRSSNSSDSHVRDGSPGTDGHIVEEDLSDSSCPVKMFKTSGRFSLNSDGSDTLDSVIMDLEELANKIRWLKGLLKAGVPFSDAKQPLWKFIEHRASVPK